MMNGATISNTLQRRGLVKICGLREPEHAAVAARAGADLLGFIFAPSRRQVSAEVARTCIAAAREASPDQDVVAVGVYVDAAPDEIRQIALFAGLDAVQLHGTESPAFAAGLGLPVIKVLRPQSGALASDILGEMASYRSTLPPPAGYLIEGYSAEAAGGVGVQADWDIAAVVSAALPFVLSGGLDPANVADAIGRVQPLGVDVSSGVEIAGAKDRNRIETFIWAAKEAFAALP